MKRLIAMLLSLVMLLSLLAGCGQDKDSNKDTAGKENGKFETTGQPSPEEGKTENTEPQQTEPKETQPAPNNDITYNNIVGVWSAKVDVLEIIEASLLEINNNDAKVSAIFEHIPKDSFIIDWFWTFSYVPMFDYASMTVEYDDADFDEKVKTFAANYMKAVYDCAISAGELSNISYEEFYDEHYQDVYSDLHSLLYSFGFQHSYVPSYQCANGKLYITAELFADEFTDEDIVDAQIDGDTLVIRTPLVLYNDLLDQPLPNETARKVLFPLTLHAVAGY